MGRHRKGGSLFGKNKSGYSARGFFGETRYFNNDNVQTGYSVKGFFGGRKRYDMNGNLISYTIKNFWGGYDTYDANGKLIKRSRKNFFEGYNTYDTGWNKTHESYKNFMGGTTYYEVAENKSGSSSKVAKTLYYNDQDEDNKERSWNGNSYIKETNQSNWESDLPNPISQIKQNIDRTVEYYLRIDEAIKYASVSKYARILAFSYKNLKEFPAIAYICNDKVQVMPLVREQEVFEFPVDEIAMAKSNMVSGLSMNDADNEFITFGISKLADEFEDLLPEYMYDNGDICRMQYTLQCGLVVTEKSIEELRKI